MADQADQQAQDFLQLWRDWLTQTERQVNALAGDAMNTDAFSRSVGGYMEVYAAFQRMFAEIMQRYLAFMNMPSRTDVTGLGETLRSIEARLARIEETLQIAAEAVDGYERAAGAAAEPLRTRRPPGLFGEEAAGWPAVPQELRRSLP
jgi:polyhydroxyalkanoic acid synthase PhaR subunit